MKEYRCLIIILILTSLVDLSANMSTHSLVLIKLGIYVYYRLQIKSSAE